MHKKFPQIKKDVKKFLVSEEGNVNKKRVFKTAIALGALGAMISGVVGPKDVDAHGTCQHCSHTNGGNHHSGW